mgnify:CR=1 FL=1
MGTVVFDPINHTYTLDGKVYPSVTQIIDAADLIDDRWYTTFAATKGTYVAEATAFDDRGVLDESSVDAVILPYIEAWRKFRRDSGYVPLEIESPIVNTDFGFAGPPDRARGMWSGRPIGLDIKTGVAEDWHDVQVGGYSILTPDMPSRWFCCYLSDDGSYRLFEKDTETGLNVFRACLTIYNWRK